MPEAVLLHGFTQTGASWDPVREQMGGAWNVTAPDLRGHGAGTDRRPISPEACAADVAAAAPARFVLAGYSMGARVALLLALDHPRRVERLVLAGATAGIEDHDERDARRRADLALADEIEASSIEYFATRWAAQPVLAGQPPEVAAAAHEDRLRNQTVALAAALRGLGQGIMEPMWKRLKDLAMPVTLVAGEHDAKYRELAERMAGLIPGGKVTIVPGAGHAVHLERPAAVAAAIRGNAE